MKRKFNCQECNIEFESNQNRKFCSRSCYAKEDSRRKKEKYTMQAHHNLGRKASVEERVIRSTKTSETWKDLTIRESRINGIRAWIDIHGHAPGWDDKTIIKRKNTVELNGGHNLKGKYGTRKCDITFKEKYGMSSHEYRTKKLRQLKKSKPEMSIEKLLTELNIDFIYQYKFKNRYFDFGIDSKKILLEVDGDYWHSKGIIYENMNNQQKNTFHNDIYKNNLVKNSDWKLIRIWESDIKFMTIDKLQTLLHD